MPADRGGTFAVLLRTARRRAGLTQQALALATELPRSLISELEHARTPVRLAHAQALAARLATTASEQQAMLACADPAAGTRRWGPLTGIAPALEQAILDHLATGFSDVAAAAALGLTPPQVATVRHLYDQPALSRGEQHARRFADLDGAIIAAYRAGVPYQAIIDRYAVPRSTLYALLARHGIPRRRRRRAASGTRVPRWCCGEGLRGAPTIAPDGHGAANR